MLQELRFKNFKLFDESPISIQTGRITVLIGANGSGKSSVLQALLLLKQSVGATTLQTNGRFIDLGAFRDVAHGREEEQPMILGLSGNDADATRSAVTSPTIEGPTYFDYDVTLRRGSVVGSDTYLRGPIVEVESRYSDRPRQSYVRPTEVVIDPVTAGDLSPSNVVARTIRVTAFRSSDEQAERAHAAQAALHRSLSAIQTVLDHYHVVPAIRGFDSLSYDVIATVAPPELTLGHSPTEQAASLANYLASEPEIAERVAEHLSRVLGREVGLRFRTIQGRIATETTSDSRSTNLLNEAFGLNQLVGGLLWLTITPPGSIVAIEDPEIHLHPKAQASLASYFVDMIREKQKQLLLTTHSEHILLALLAAVANGQIPPEALTVYEFERTADSAQARQIAVNQYGQIEGGLRGFLEVDMDEIGDFIRARVAHTQQ